jgi:hypothetical protein
MTGSVKYFVNNFTSCIVTLVEEMSHIPMTTKQFICYKKFQVAVISKNVTHI